LGIMDTSSELLNEFVPAFYLTAGREIPPLIITSHALPDAPVIASVLGDSRGSKVAISHSVRSHRAGWVAMAKKAAEQNLTGRINSHKNTEQRMQSLQEVLGLDAL